MVWDDKKEEVRAADVDERELERTASNQSARETWFLRGRGLAIMAQVVKTVGTWPRAHRHPRKFANNRPVSRYRADHTAAYSLRLQQLAHLECQQAIKASPSVRCRASLFAPQPSKNALGEASPSICNHFGYVESTPFLRFACPWISAGLPAAVHMAPGSTWAELCEVQRTRPADRGVPPMYLETSIIRRAGVSMVLYAGVAEAAGSWRWRGPGCDLLGDAKRGSRDEALRLETLGRAEKHRLESHRVPRS